MEGLKDIVRVECGTDFTLALDKNGKLYSFGDNSYGQLGLNSDAIKVTEPKKIFTSTAQGKVVDFACGEEHGAFVDSRGNAHTFGFGQDGQLGHGEKQNINTPKRV